jgi:hypothetical protein
MPQLVDLSRNSLWKGASNSESSVKQYLDFLNLEHDCNLRRPKLRRLFLHYMSLFLHNCHADISEGS